MQPVHVRPSFQSHIVAVRIHKIQSFAQQLNNWFYTLIQLHIYFYLQTVISGPYSQFVFKYLQVAKRSHKSHMQPVCSQVDMSCLCCMHETWTMSCAIKGQRILQKKGTLWLHRSQTQQKCNVLTLSNTPLGVLYLPTEQVKGNINVSGNICSAGYTLQALHNELHITDGMTIMYNKTS
jgi:hypothetical protein